MARAIMIQGAGSNVGKSMLVAGLARALVRRGVSVAPFKPQNMSNNAAVTADGGEIGRAQALQARAAGRAASVDMNPVLLKPESDTGAQVIVQGHRQGTLRAGAYGRRKGELLPRVLDSFSRLSAGADVVLVEGAGSPAEINLRAGDIANMGFAEAAGVPVVLVGDIDRGGVIAQCVGTHAVLSEADRARIRGFAVNKFRGDPNLFADGMAAIAARTGWRDLGLVPWFADAWRLPAEDALDISSGPHRGAVKVAVPLLPRIANFDDLDPLSAEPEVTVDMVPPGRALPGDADLVLLPGTKSTIADLAAFRAQGWDIDLTAHLRRGGRALGICGGYQMLGRRIADPDGLEGPPQSVDGLGHLDVETVMRPMKRLALGTATCRDSGAPLAGYEIHIGDTTGPDTARPWLTLDGAPHGAASADGRVRGCYLHGLFASDAFRAHWLTALGAPPGDTAYEAGVESTLDALAAHLETHIDIDALLALAEPV
ncbi:adenosylcobyric acid synthase (glutamine-hydrolysing) [Tranquillimonas rosea]|uniref:Cobyric acid synthase n=1 Tax=Tranquillimonas rosea TaxID=641238 RepID=A0A1H9WY20_9RHOB|nr:cobyric acid synthase [Tranquillimonas rosea]SES38745.1 adenosylcobyric acid synthase (glutamine-hydrolysing) [Tranquillimonas rosea]